MADSKAGDGKVADIEPHKLYDTILVLDFGSQFSHLLTRRMREFNIYAEMLPCTQKLAELTWKPVGVILSGGPYSVYEAGAPHVDPAFLELGVPVLGICYGMQELAYRLSQDSVVAGTEREYGHADLTPVAVSGHVDRLFEGLGEAADQSGKGGGMRVWMSHGDKLRQLPEGFRTIGTTRNSEYAAIGHATKPVYAIQFHPEVTHTLGGDRLLRNFAAGICGARQNWTMANFVEQELARIRKLVGPAGQVLGAVSGGVDSTVAAKLMHEAIGERFHAVLVDNGCLRLNEAAQVHQTLTKHLGINLTVVDASQQFLDGLRGITDPELKRKFIGGKFIDIFEAEAARIEAAAEAAAAAAGHAGTAGKIGFFLQGTLYPDVIESISFKGPSQTIKTHHNVGGLPKRMTEGHGLRLIEPLRELFKDEVRQLGRSLHIDEELIMRHPFPGPGLAIRVLGEVTPERVEMARQADARFIEMIRERGFYNQIGQAFAALDPSRAVGVMGDKRVYEHIVILRAIETRDFMSANPFPFEHSFLAEVATRITNEVAGVCRVVYDLTSKPPGTIELE